MRILIVDDEPLARARLAALLGQCSQVGPVDAAGDGETALAMCAERVPDLLLADINMPGMDGTALIRRLADRPHAPQVIFCTAYEHFAAQAFELGAADYLLKPVRLARLHEALERARRLRAPDDPAPTSVSLTVRMGANEHRVVLDDVFYLLAGDKYVSVHHSGGEDLTDSSLRQLEQRYAEQLIRLHRGCLVPRQRLLGLTAGSEGATLARLAGTDATPHVSRRNLAAVRKLLHG